MNLDSDIDALIGGVGAVMGGPGASLDAKAAEVCSFSEGSFCDHKKVGFWEPIQLPVQDHHFHKYNTILHE